MVARVEFVYQCCHAVELEGDDIPTWIMVEFYSGFDLERNSWTGMWYDNGSITIDDICLVCKEDLQKAEMELMEEQRKEKEAAALEKQEISEKTKVGTESEHRRR